MIKFHQMITFNDTAVFYKNGVLHATDDSQVSRKKVRGETFISRTDCYTIDPNDDMAVNMTFPTNFSSIDIEILTEVTP